jgi:hypothetical protein
MSRTKRYSPDDAFDERGLLRDGYRYRTSMRAMDSARGPMRITDGNGDSGEFAFSRPGYRIMNDAAARDAREAAHREYLDYITSAYKQPQPVRDQDTRAGEPGLVDHDEPTHFSRPRITDGSGNCSELAFSRPGWRMLADASVNDARPLHRPGFPCAPAASSTMKRHSRLSRLEFL